MQNLPGSQRPCGCIWKDRNHFIFRKSPLNPYHTLFKALTLQESFANWNIKPKEQKERDTSSQKWQPPDPGTIQINIDASYVNSLHDYPTVETEQDKGYFNSDTPPYPNLQSNSAFSQPGESIDLETTTTEPFLHSLGPLMTPDLTPQNCHQHNNEAPASDLPELSSAKNQTQAEEHPICGANNGAIPNLVSRFSVDTLNSSEPPLATDLNHAVEHPSFGANRRDGSRFAQDLYEAVLESRDDEYQNHASSASDSTRGLASKFEKVRPISTQNRGTVACVCRDSFGRIVDGFTKSVAVNSAEQAEVAAFVET